MNRLEEISALHAKQNTKLELRRKPDNHNDENYEGDWWSTGETFRVSFKGSPDDSYISSNAQYYNVSLSEILSKEFVLLHNAWPAIEKALKAADNAISRFERDYEKVPFNWMIFDRIEEYREALKELEG